MNKCYDITLPSGDNGTETSYWIHFKLYAVYAHDNLHKLCTLLEMHLFLER